MLHIRVNEGRTRNENCSRLNASEKSSVKFADVLIYEPHLLPGSVIWRTREPLDLRRTCRWCRTLVVCDLLPVSNRKDDRPVRNMNRDASRTDLR